MSTEKFIKCLKKKESTVMLSVRIPKALMDELEGFVLDHEEYNKSEVVQAMIKYCLEELS